MCIVTTAVLLGRITAMFLVKVLLGRTTPDISQGPVGAFSGSTGTDIVDIEDGGRLRSSVYSMLTVSSPGLIGLTLSQGWTDYTGWCHCYRWWVWRVRHLQMVDLESLSPTDEML